MNLMAKELQSTLISLDTVRSLLENDNLGIDTASATTHPLRNGHDS